MILAIGSLTAMGAALGTVLGVAARYFAVEGNPLEAEILGLLPGSNCAQCGFVGCAGAAAALAAGEAQVTLCPPGGKAVAEKLAKKLGVSVDLSHAEDKGPQVAFINEDSCIGCLRCIKDCSTDAIVGAPKQMHTVVSEVCHGCGKCFKVCPTEAIEMRPIATTIETWHWHKPGSTLSH
ncbi:MAG TPA: RnfABCDGE type electron transport complex subunit B [Rhodospirillaceae bacterium]|nr:RnfABCDGE type electron transport complex subunit B [Rhodospirillaceae bacterium]